MTGASFASCSTCALRGPGKLLRFFPALFAFGAIASEDTLTQARCAGVSCLDVGRMDQAHKIIAQMTSSQLKVTISSHYRPRSRLLFCDDSKLEHDHRVPADTRAL